MVQGLSFSVQGFNVGTYLGVQGFLCRYFEAKLHRAYIGAWEFWGYFLEFSTGQVQKVRVLMSYISWSQSESYVGTLEGTRKEPLKESRKAAPKGTLGETLGST